MDWERKGFLSDSMTKPLLHAGSHGEQTYHFTYCPLGA